MDELEKEKNKIKQEAKKVRKQPVNNIKEEIDKNYKIGIKYFRNIEETEE